VYERAISKWIPIDFSRLSEFEKSDMGEGAQSLACTAGGCEV